MTRRSAEASAPDAPDLDALLDMPAAQLRVLWRRYLPRQAEPRASLLAHELASRLQARAHGDIDASTKRLVDAAVRGTASRRASRDATARPSPDASAGPAPAKPVPSRRPRRAPPRQPDLVPGATLVRRWRGHDHAVAVLARNRFAYAGDTYASLSEIARVITGTRWSGPRFFGLTRRGSTA